jgi:serine/threonine-protein kinase HipA
MNRLLVLLYGKKIGTLDQEEDGSLLFQYDRHWLKKGAIPLSRSLPLRPDPFKGDEVRPYFEGLLPAGNLRHLVEKNCRVKEGDVFNLLRCIGGECAGAVSVQAERKGPVLRRPRKVIRLAGEGLAAVVASLPKYPLLAGKSGVRLSISGTRNKLPVVLRGADTFLPSETLRSTHFLKIGVVFPFFRLLEGEAFCSDLAAAVGLKVAPAKTRMIGETRCLEVERYDRCGPNGTTVWWHQEDFHQALGMLPEAKYKAESAPPAQTCVNMIREWSTCPALDLLAFLDGLVFGALIGRIRPRGAGFSFIYRDGERRLAPSYDWDDGITNGTLMEFYRRSKDSGGADPESLTESCWRTLADECRLSWPWLRERILRLCAKAVKALGDPQGLRGRHINTLVTKAADIIQERADTLHRNLLSGG